MSGMFQSTDHFNQPLDSWDVSNCQNMSKMFHFAVVFNQPLTSWYIQNVRDMKSMFHYALRYNQSLLSWEWRNDRVCNDMFHACPMDSSNVGTEWQSLTLGSRGLVKKKQPELAPIVVNRKRANAVDTGL